MNQKYNSLTFAQRYKLTNWVASQKHWIDEAKPSYEQVAEEATKALGFAVSYHNVMSSAKVAGVKWPRRHSAVGKKSPYPYILARAILELAGEFGITLSDPRIEQIAKGRRLTEEQEEPGK